MLLGAVAIALLALLPGRVNHATLSDSVASSVSDAVTRGLGYDADCRPADTAWRCVLTTTDASDSGVTYNVAISGNCWSAVLSNPAGMLGLPARAKDCIHLVDQLTDGQLSPLRNPGGPVEVARDLPSGLIDHGQRRV